jgi:HEAT repeat protein
MSTKAILVGLGAAALLGGGLWLGRSSSATAEPPATPAAQLRSAAIPVTAAAARPARSPTLPARHIVATPGLASDLTATDPRIRRAAVREAARDSDLDPAVLLAASRDPDLEVAITATIALGKRYADGTVPAAEMIARATDRGLNDRVRVTALNAIGLVPSPDGAALLVEMVARGSVIERASAAILLVHQDPELAMPALIGALGDADEQVRANALASLQARSRGRDFGSDAAAWQAWWQARPR